MRRRYSITPPMPVDDLAEPCGGGLYFVTAEPGGWVIYIGRSVNFKGRGFRRHHKRSYWDRACGVGERPAVRFATLHPALSPLQLRDVEATLIDHAAPPCNEQHVVRTDNGFDTSDLPARDEG